MKSLLVGMASLLSLSMLAEPLTLTFGPELDGYVNINDKGAFKKGRALSSTVRAKA